MVITSDTHADHVKASIIEFMNHAEDAGEILLITWNAYVDLPYLNRRENWRFSRFGDTLIASPKGEFDEIANFRSDQNRRFLTRRRKRNRDRSSFDSRQYLERNPHQKLVWGGAIFAEIGLLA
jgi:hypothetical protein